MGSVLLLKHKGILLIFGNGFLFSFNLYITGLQDIYKHKDHVLHCAGSWGNHLLGSKTVEKSWNV